MHIGVREKKFISIKIFGFAWCKRSPATCVLLLESKIIILYPGVKPTIPHQKNLHGIETYDIIWCEDVPLKTYISVLVNGRELYGAGWLIDFRKF